MLTSIVRRSASSSRQVVIAVLAFAVLAAIAGSTLLSGMTTETDAPNAQSVQAAKRLTAASGMSIVADVVAIVTPEGGLNGQQGRYRFSEIAAGLYTFDDAASVQSYLNNPDPSLVSKDEKSAIIAVQFKNSVDRNVTAKKIIGMFAGQGDVALGGAGVAGAEIQDRVDGDLGTAELFALPLLFLIAIWVFRGVVAAAVTIAVGVLAIVVTLGVLRGIATQTELSSFVLNIVTGLGLGLAIDYCLFIVSRYREEVAVRGYTTEAAIAAGLAAGRTVFFSASTVAASTASLMLFPQRFLFSLGIGGTVVTLVAATVSIVVLPAVLVLLGPRIDALGLPGAKRALEIDSGDVRRIAWYRLARWVMEHARVVMAGVVIVVMLLLSPALHVQFSNINVKVLPVSSEPRMVSQRISDDFPGGEVTTLNIAVIAPKDRAAEVSEYAGRVAKVRGVSGVSPAAYLGSETWLIDGTVAADPFSDQAQVAVNGVRSLTTANKVLVGGEAAAFMDNKTSVEGNLPASLLLVGVAVLLLVFLMTGSLVLAVKTFVVNVLNVMMTVGVLVWIFQEGHFESLLGFTSTGAIDLGTPILVIILGFGLSTDYGVFLLARVKESFEQTGDNDDSVATGVGRSGRIISSAAVLMCVAVGAFSTSSVLFIKQLGVGVAVSVLLDATVIRAFLVPSAMKLMANVNWWAPAALRKVHDRFGWSELPAIAGESVHSPVVMPTTPEISQVPAVAAFAAADVAAKLADAGWTTPTLSGAPSGPPKLRLIESPSFTDEWPALTIVPSAEDEQAASAQASMFRVSPVHAAADTVTSPPSRHRAMSGDQPSESASRAQSRRSSRRAQSRYFRKPAHLRIEAPAKKAAGRHRH